MHTHAGATHQTSAAISAAKITVIVADDHAVVRQGLIAGLANAADIHVIAEAGNGREAVDQAEKLKPAVLLLDLAMPVLNGIQVAQRLHASVPDCKIIIWSCYTDVQEVLHALEAGAVGYLAKDGTIAHVADALRAAARGASCFTPSIARALLHFMRQELSTAESIGSEIPLLSAREKQVLALIGLGKSNDEIAAYLGISPKTAEKHRGSLMRKLEIHDRASLTRYAIASGLVLAPRPLLADDRPQAAMAAPPEPPVNNALTTAALRDGLRDKIEQNKRLRSAMKTVAAQVDQILAEAKEVKKRIPFRRKPLSQGTSSTTGP